MQTIASFKPGIPKILEWDFTPAASASEHTCLLVVMDSASDPMPPGSKVFEIRTLAATDKRIGLKNLHVLDPKQAPSTGITCGILSFGLKGGHQTIEFVPHGGMPRKVSLFFSKQAILTTKYGSVAVGAFDTTRSYTLASTAQPGSLSAALGSKTIRAIVAVEGAPPGNGGAAFSILQLSGQQVEGGSTFAMKVP